MSDKHDELAIMALTWLSNKVTGKGMRGTTEVCLSQGYVADAVAICSLQYTYNSMYIEHSGYKPAIMNRTYNRETGKIDTIVRGDKIDNYYACIFEAKASRSDFLSTFNDKEKHLNRRFPIGSLHWCVANKGVCGPDELPDFWGLLETYGSGLTEKKRPLIKILTSEQLDKIAHALLWPLQAGRKYFICKICNTYAYEGYCTRCRGGIPSVTGS
ncbi:MAG: hypothetical protein MUO31_13160 [Thermodesulfovibrionales bacterium]|nr:hypothetical protein [Thermodesulfovibrionales bacterium]